MIPDQTDSSNNPNRMPSSGASGETGAPGILSHDSEHPLIMLSVPMMADASVDVPGESNADSQAKSSTVVKIKLPDSNPLQNLVQGGRQRFIDLAGGSLFWRTFVGSGVAVLIGAITIVLVGPAAKPTPQGADEATANQIKVAPRTASSETTDHDETGIRKPQVQLTVGTSETGDGSQPAEIDDPFLPENQVPAKLVHAVHFTNDAPGNERSVIHTVSQQRPVAGQPVWLSGTIEDVEDSVQPMRKHERSRPSHR